MQGRIVMAALAAMAMLAAGCIQAPAFSADDKTEVSAMANHDLADNAAKAWNPDAKLVGLGTGELNRSQDGLPADPNPGNGKAVAWTFLYAAGNDSRAFEVAADGHLVSGGNNTDGRAAAAEKDLVPLGEWKIDSHDAMSEARKNETFGAAARAPNATFGEMLGREQGSDSPGVWYLLAFSSKGSVLAQVDAVKGDLLLVQEFRMDFKMPNMEQYNVKPAAMKSVQVKDHGSLDASKTTKSVPFTLPEDGMAGTLRLQTQSQTPFDQLQWEIKRADGQTAQKGSAGRSMGSSTSAKLKPLPAGDYELVFTYASNAPVAVPGGSVTYDANAVFGHEMPTEG